MNKITLRKKLVLGTFIGLIGSSSYAQIFKCVDEKGQLSYSNEACAKNEVVVAAIDEKTPTRSTDEVPARPSIRPLSEEIVEGNIRETRWAHAPIRNVKFSTDSETILEARLALQSMDRLALLNRR